MPDTAALVVALSAQLTKFETDMQKANEIARTHVQQIENTFSSANLKIGGLDELGEKLTRLLTIGGIIEGVRRLAELNGQVAKMGDQAAALGLTTDQLQKLQYAAAASGSSTEKMSEFLDAFSRKVGDAALGSGKLYLLLRENGIAAQDFAKLPLNTQLAKFSDLLAGIASPAERMSQLIAASGRGFAELLPLLSKGGNALHDIGEEGERTGTIIGPDLIAQAKKTNEEWQVLLLQSKVFFETLAISGANAGKTIAKQSEDNAKEVKGWFDGIIDYVKTNAPQLYEIISSQFEKITTDVKQKRADMKSASDKSMAVTGNEPGVVLPDKAQLDKINKFDYDFGVTKIITEQEEAFRKLIQSQQKRIELLDSETSHISESAGAQALYKTEIDLYNQAVEKNAIVTEAQYDAILRVAGATALSTQRAFQARQQWEGLNSVVQFAGNQMIDVMIGLAQGTLTASKAMQQLTNALIKALLQAALLGQGPLGNLLFPAAQAGGTGGLGGFAVTGLKSLFGRQGGGPVSSGHPYVVGEHGPELFVPGSSGNIVPNTIARGRTATGASVIINNYMGNDAQVNQRQQGGGIDGEQTIIDIVKRAQTRGEFDSSNRTRFALRPAKVR